MALLNCEPPNLKIWKGKDGKWHEETIEHWKKRITNEKKQAYEEELKDIIKNGFTRKQAIYLHGMEKSIIDAGRHGHEVY